MRIRLPTTQGASQVECKKEFDQKFIYDAIEQWYGSHDAFRDYVRGPLQQELLKKQADTRLPLEYTCIVLTPFLSVQFARRTIFRLSLL